MRILEEQIKQTIETYDDTVNEYEANTREIEYFASLRDFSEKLPKGARVLDLGCGWGKDSEFLYNYGFQVEGIDLSAKMIHRAKELFPKINFRVKDIRNLDYESNTFDGIWASASLLHIPRENILNVIRSLFRFIKKGGFIFLSVKQGLEHQAKEEFIPDHRYGDRYKFWSFYEPETISGYLEQTGFVIDTIRLDTIKKSSYSTNPWIEIVAQKTMEK